MANIQMQNMSQQQYQMEEIPLNDQNIKTSERRKAYTVFAKVSHFFFYYF